MWLKRIFKGEKGEKQMPQTPTEAMEENQDIAESKIVTVSQEQVDSRYSTLKIINHKSVHISQNLLHFTQSVFLEEIGTIQIKSQFSQNFFVLDELVVTDRQIIMMPDRLTVKKRTDHQSIYLGMIQRLEILEVKKGSPSLLQFILKDSRAFQMRNGSGNGLKDIEKLIRQFAFPNGINKIYAFKYGKVPKKINGWNIYNRQQEYTRQGLKNFLYDSRVDKNPSQQHAYQVVINKNFELSPTYPIYLIAPLGLTYQQIVRCSKFRTKQRLPTLTYLYEYSPGCYSSLFRCSQIKSGILSARNQDDQEMIRQISQSTKKISKRQIKKQQNVNCRIYDARGFYAALGNKLSGKGFQHVQNYHCELEFLNIPNIHAVRECYNKIRAYNSEQKEFVQVLGQSGWIDYLFLILIGAKSMARSLIQGVNVVVHCSDGWDRTTQLSVLTQLIIQPYYRTLQGFIVLFQKDWKSYGHKFRQRSGQYNFKDYHQHEISPIFLQFLDCVVQMINQFPLSFEFNLHFLEFIGKQYQSNTYGTFLTNNIKQSTQIKLQQATISIWSDILEHRQKYINPFYYKQGPKILDISVDSKDFVIWKQFLMEQTSLNEQQWQLLKRQKEINNNLRESIQNYEKQIEKLKEQISK